MKQAQTAVLGNGVPEALLSQAAETRVDSFPFSLLLFST